MLGTLTKSKSFARLFYASLTSEIGSKIHRIALLVLVYTLTEEALWVSLALVTQLIATVGLGPLLSAWADTQDRRRLLIYSDLLRAPLVLLIPFVGADSLGLLLLLVFAIEMLRNLHDPVAHAVIPELVNQEEVDAANGLMLFAQRFAEVAFVGLAGLLVAVVGPLIAFWIDAITYLVSAMILIGLPRLDPGDFGQTTYGARVKEGIHHLWSNRAIRRTVLTLFVAALFGSVETVLGVVLAVSVLRAGSTGFGVLEAAMASGAVLGTLLVPRLAVRVSRERLFLLGLLLFGLFEASVGVLPIFAWALAAYLGSGVLNMVFIIPARSILQLNTPKELRTRTFAAFGAVMNSAVVFGTLVGGVLEKPLGAPSVFVIAGLMVALVALSVLLSGGIRSDVPSMATRGTSLQVGSSVGSD